MDLILTQEEIRVLGCLIEKKMATPEYYPLSLNALVNACNQKSNRDPVVSWDEQIVLEGLEGLTAKRMIFQSHLSRVAKYEESFLNENDFVPSESAILCVLMLRGPQTAGEIRGRTERLYSFDNLDHVNRIIEQLITRNHVVRLERLPGRKEVRYMHTLGGTVEDDEPDQINSEAQTVSTPAPSPPHVERIQTLELKVEELSAELKALRQEFFDFRKQFE